MSELYQLPDGWEWVEWYGIVDIKNGKHYKDVINPNGKYPIYGSGGVINFADEYLCNEDSVIIGRKGTINNPIFVKEKFWNIDTAFGLEANRNLLIPMFLYYFAQYFNFLDLNTATTMPSLTKSNLQKIKMPLPSIIEQKRIVQKLDALFERIDKAIALLQKNINAADNFMNSVLNEVFSNLEQNYRLLELDKTVDFGGKNIVAINNPDLIYLSLEDIEADTGKVINYRTVSEAGAIGTSVLFDNHCVLYSKLRPYLNKVIVPEISGCATTELVVIKPHTNLFKYFLSYFLRNPTVMNLLNNDSMGAKMPRTNMKTFKKLSIPIPEYEKQLEVVKYLDSISAKIEQLKSAQQQKMQSLLNLKSSILDQAFHGKL